MPYQEQENVEPEPIAPELDTESGENTDPAAQKIIQCAENILKCAEGLNPTPETIQVLQNELENRLRLGNFSGVLEMMNFVKKRKDIPLDLKTDKVSTAFLEGLKRLLESDNMMQLDVSKYLAKRLGIKIDFSDSELKAAAQRCLKRLLSVGDIDRVEKLIEFVGSTRLNFRDSEISAAAQKGLELQLKNGDIDYPGYIQDFCKTYHIKLIIVSPEIPQITQQLFTTAIAQSDIDYARSVKQFAEKYNIRLNFSTIEIQKAFKGPLDVALGLNKDHLFFDLGFLEYIFEFARTCGINLDRYKPKVIAVLQKERNNASRKNDNAKVAALEQLVKEL